MRLILQHLTDCAQHKDTPNFVDFEITQVKVNEYFVLCLWSGGLPSPEPDYTPVSISSNLQPGVGQITGVQNNPNHATSCYTYNAYVSDSPTKAPVVTLSPTKAPITPSPTKSHSGTHAPTTAAALTSAPTSAALGLYTHVGSGVCVDSNGQDFSSKMGWSISQGWPAGNPVDVAASYCS
jgi:hypothetical protein